MITDTESPAFKATIEVRESLAFDVDRLGDYLRAHIPSLMPTLKVRQFKGGQSNPTYLLIDALGKQFVLRRKPPGKLLKSAHAVDREYKVITALGQTEVAVPKTYHLCTDESIIGTWFYVMDCVDGRIFWDPSLPEIPKIERRGHTLAMAETMAKLHNVDYEKIGLGDYGKPGNYFERQIGRWAGHYQSDTDAGKMDTMDRLCEWLPENIPQGDEASIVHGDFRLDNMVFHPREPRVIAILDWELSTLGHPLSDFAYSCLFYRLTQKEFAGFGGNDPRPFGLPSEVDYIAHYCKLTGREGIPHMDYYMAFNMFRLAAIIHGIKGRLIRGNASSKQADATVAKLEPLANIAWAQVDKIMRKSS